MELADTADMVTDAMSTLGIEATSDNLTTFGDQLAKTSQKSNTSIAQLGEVILTVGGTVKNLAGGTEDGDFLTVKGCSVESMLTRRILFNHRNENNTQPYTIGGFNVEYPTDTHKTVEDCIRHALEMTIAPTDLNPYGAKWAWDGNFTLGNRQGFTESMPQTQILGAYLYDFIVKQCQTYGYGFKVHLNDNKKFEFNLYKGCDCSYNQQENPYIIFSPEFDNLSNTNYLFDTTNYKNYTYGIGKADIEMERLWKGRPIKNGMDTNRVNRRELFVDDSSISEEEKDSNENNIAMTDTPLFQLLALRRCNFMVYKSGFFNSMNGDRKYKSEDMSHFYGQLISNGVLSKTENSL